MANHDKIKLISECYIKPKYKNQTSEQPHYLSPDDLLMLSLHYIQKGLLFAKPSTFDSTELNSFSEDIKHSLSSTLVHFYPLAGRLVTKINEQDNTCWVYVDCDKGPGARFIHAKADQLTVSDIVSSSTDVVPITRTFFELGERCIVNHDGHTRALLSVQVTDLVDGLVVGFTMNHSVVDGTTFWHFVSSLSETFSTGESMISRVPVFRSSFLEGYDSIIKLPFVNSDQFITRFDENPQQRERVFHFSAKSVAILKAKANKDGGNKISSFQSLSALLWISITKARNLQHDEETTCSLVANSRPRFDPPFSQEYFGNFGLMAQGTSKVGELLRNGIGWAATLLHQGVAAQDNNAARSALKAGIEAPFIAQPGWGRSFFGTNPIVIGGSVRFDVYGPKFGLGKAIAVLAGYANKQEGKVTAYPGFDGGGSVDLEVCLKADTMRNLELDDDFMNFVS